MANPVQTLEGVMLNSAARFTQKLSDINGLSVVYLPHSRKILAFTDRFGVARMIAIPCDQNQRVLPYRWSLVYFDDSIRKRVETRPDYKLLKQFSPLKADTVSFDIRDKEQLNEFGIRSYLEDETKILLPGYIMTFDPVGTSPIFVNAYLYQFIAKSKQTIRDFELDFRNVFGYILYGRPTEHGSCYLIWRTRGTFPEDVRCYLAPALGKFSQTDQTLEAIMYRVLYDFKEVRYLLLMYKYCKRHECNFDIYEVARQVEQELNELSLNQVSA